MLIFTTSTGTATIDSRLPAQNGFYQTGRACLARNESPQRDYRVFESESPVQVLFQK